MTSTANLQANVVRECFGAALSDIGRGFFVTLELLAILRGGMDLQEHDGTLLLQVPAPGDPVRYARKSHDFARRMPTDPELLDPSELGALEGTDTRAALAALVDALTVPFPGRRGRPPFKRRLLYPYVGELIHYDAVDRRGRVSLEQYTFRGAGGLVYKMLGRDSDKERLARNESGLMALVSDSGSALGRLASAMQAHDVVPRPGAPSFFEDESARLAEPRIEGSWWTTALCDGVANIVGRASLTRAKRVEMLMHWIPYCIARYQLEVATAVLEREPEEIPIDLRTRPNTIRRASQELLQRIPSTIGQALAVTASKLSLENEQDRAGYAEIAESALGARATLKNARAFFTSTMWTVGALNAQAGTRHFTLRLPLLETIVAAGIRPDGEMPFTEFCSDVLFARYGLLVDQGAARRSAIGDAIDTAEFEENGEILARKLMTLGLLTEYSDATRIVHAEVRA
jgi:hypothetical protein